MKTKNFNAQSVNLNVKIVKIKKMNAHPILIMILGIIFQIVYVYKDFLKIKIRFAKNVNIPVNFAKIKLINVYHVQQI